MCSAGACTVTCGAGLTNCNGACVNLLSDPSNCGTCSKVCNLPNASSACSAGACAVTSCSGSFANCDGNSANGCEANLTSDGNNCGTCGNACGSPPFSNGGSCSGSKCSFTCQANHFNQNGQYGDGCECASAGSGATTCPGAAVGSPSVTQGRLLGATSNWYAVSFPNENTVCGQHYQLVLTNNGNPIQMTVFQNCSYANVTCGGGEAASGYTTWTWNNLAGAGTNCLQTYPTTFFVQVFSTGNAPTCMDYTLTAFIQ